MHQKEKHIKDYCEISSRER